MIHTCDVHARQEALFVSAGATRVLGTRVDVTKQLCGGEGLLLLLLLLGKYFEAGFATLEVVAVERDADGRASEEALARLAREHAEVDARRLSGAHGARRAPHHAVLGHCAELD